MRRAKLLLGLLLVSSPFPAAAAVIEVSFEGTISFVADVLASGFTLGEPVTGSFEIDTESPDLAADPNIGEYDAVSNLALDFGGYVPTTGGVSRVYVEDGVDPAFDEFNIGAEASGADVGGAELQNFFLDLLDAERTAITGDDVPTTLTLADFETRRARLGFAAGGFSYYAESEITTLSYQVVPEPSGAHLAGAGALTLAAAGLVRRMRASA